MSLNYNYCAWSTADDAKMSEMGVFSSDPADLIDYSETEPFTDMVEWNYEDAKKLAEKLLYADGVGGKITNETCDLSSMDISLFNGNAEPINPRFKTEFCRNFREKGSCQYGEHCQFAHGKNELRPDVVRHSKYKTKLCQKYWIAGYCAYGARCNFIHQQEETFDTKPVTTSGLRPFNPSFRRSSESSIDSGVESVFSQPKFMRDQFKLICPPSDNGIKEPKLTTSPPSRHADLNLNTSSTDINFNMNGDTKGSFSVPHPEHNPIQLTTRKHKDLDYYRSCEAGIWNTLF